MKCKRVGTMGRFSKNPICNKGLNGLSLHNLSGG